jgi:CRISPR-associated endonuclease/helicase Cas3
MMNSEDRLCSADLWAKSNGDQCSIEDHTNAVLAVMEQEIVRHTVLIDRISLISCIPKEDLLQQARIAALTHDLGKSTERFQQFLRNKKPKEFIHHRVASIPYVYLVNSCFGICDKWFCLSIPAVVSHHKLFSLSNKSQDDFGRQKVLIDSTGVDYCPGSFELLWNYVKHVAQQYGWQSRQQIDDTPLEVLTKKLLGKFTSNYLSTPDIDSLRNYRLPFMLVKGLLQSSDWQASGNWYPEYGVLRDLAIRTEAATVERAVQKGLIISKEKFKWRDFQVEISKTDGNVVGIAPCGVGKTESAALWANTDPQHRQIIYLLPTQVTSNRIYERWNAIMSEFVPSPVGLLHSAARYYHFTTNRSDPEIVPDQLKKELSTHRAFAMPVTIATVDQALFSMFNGGYWNQSLLRLSGANIIFDEIHSYQPYTLGLILRMVNYLSELNARFAFISATMPSKLVKLLSAECPDIRIVKDKTIRKPLWKLHDCTDRQLSKMKKEMLSCYSEGKKVLVVANNIAHAREIYEVLPKSIDKYLIHSAFMQKDRNYKEEKLEELSKSNMPCIVVATQVVEVSLDVNMDVLFTEMCPVDALVQRLGRVNRYGNGIADVWIAAPHERSSKIYGMELLVKSLQALMHEKSDIVLSDDIYREALESSFNWLYESKQFQDQLERGRRGFDEFWYKNSYIFDLDLSDEDADAATRPEDYPRVEVIPAEYKDGKSIRDEYKTICDSKDGLTLGRGFVVRIPMWQMKKFIIDKAPHGYFVNMKYSSDLGVLNEAVDNIF